LFTSGATAFMTMSLIFCGTFGLRVRGGEMSSPFISFSRSAGAGVLYGSTPVNIWYIVTPSE
jgi:hypothetical protein